MWKTNFLKKINVYALIIVFIALALIIFSGQLGNGKFFNIKTAFGYGGGGGGGGGTPPPPTAITAVNVPLTINNTQAGDLSLASSNGAKVEVQIPQGAVSQSTTFNSTSAAPETSNLPLASSNASLVGSQLFNINAHLTNNTTPVNNFPQKLLITLSIPSMPTDTSNLGVYYFDTNYKQWVKVSPATFDAANKKVSFYVNHLTTFAVFEVGGVPSVMTTPSTTTQQPTTPTPPPLTIPTPAPSTAAPTVSADKTGLIQFKDGELIKGKDKKIYVIKDGKAVLVASLMELKKYAGKPVKEVSPEVLNKLKEAVKTVVTTLYKNGDLVRGADNRIYVIINGKKQAVPSLAELKNYAGKAIKNLTPEQINTIENAINPVAAPTVKATYINGDLIRGTNKKVYVIENGKKTHIANVAELNKYAGKPIYDVNDTVISQFK